MNNEVKQSSYQLALICIENKDITNALKNLNTAIEIEPNNVEVLNSLALCYFILGDFDEAEKRWYEVLKIDATNNEAKASLDHLLSPAFSFWIKRYHSVLKEIEKRNYDVAIKELKKLMEENDTIIGVYQLLGLCYLAKGDKKYAVKIWRKGLAIDKSNPQLIDYLNLQSNITELPIENLNTSINIKPKENMKNKWGWAVAGVLIIAVLVQGTVAINNNRSYTEDLSKMEVKIKQLSDIVEQQKNEIALTVASFNNVNSIEIEEDYSDTLAGSNYDVNYENHYYNTGYNAYLSKDYKNAISNLSVVVAMNTNSYINREAAYYLARSYYLNGELAQAEKYYKQYLEQFPNTNYYDDSLFFLGCVYYKLDRIDDAKRVFEQLEDFNPTSGYLTTNMYKNVMN